MRNEQLLLQDANDYIHSKGPEALVELEAMMVQASFGHEYGLMKLNEEKCLPRRNDLLDQIEQHKQNYFWARERLCAANPDRLEKIESDIQFQKMAILKQHPTFH